jgi:hypothetical protein
MTTARSSLLPPTRSAPSIICTECRRHFSKRCDWFGPWVELLASIRRWPTMVQARCDGPELERVRLRVLLFCILGEADRDIRTLCPK